jgi:MFS family permease
MASSETTASTDIPVTALSPLRFPAFRGILLASCVSNVGGLIQAVGASWMMTSIADSADLVALVQASMTMPVVLLSLLAGALADSIDRRRIMLVAQAFMLTVSIILSVCAWTGTITSWSLLLLTFLIGCGTAFHAPAWQASVGDMVPRAHLSSAITLNGVGFNVARTVGPAIGGAIVAAAGAAAAFAVNTSSYFVLLFVLKRWRPAREVRRLPRESLGIAIMAGLRYVTMSPTILRVLLRSSVFALGASSVMALMPLLAKDRLAGGALTYGLLLGAFGVGSVAAAMGKSRMGQKLATEALVRWACMAFALSAAVAGVSTSLVLTLLALLIGGAAWVSILVTLTVSVQMSAPRWVVARALSLYQMAAFAGLAGGSWLWGVITEHQGLSTALLLAAVILFGCALLGRWLPIPEVEALNLDPLDAWSEPQTAVPVESRTGPVVISIEYRIREADIIAFLAAMAARQRVRRRDGAQNWMLLRDLADPEIWIERYMTPTWLDYIRHNSRLTHEDANIPERLRALHCGPDKPVVRRMIERQTGSLPSGDSPARDMPEPFTDPSRSA